MFGPILLFSSLCPSNFAIICIHGEEKAASWCFVSVKGVQWLFIMVPWVGLQYVIVVFPDHNHLRF